MNLPLQNEQRREANVILIEDEVLIAEEIRHALEDEGFTICGTPSTAAEAIAICAHRRPDIAIVDIRLKGGVDGIDTANALRHQFNIPIVFLTAHANQTDLERAKRVEPVGFVMKPVVIPELVAGLKLGLVKHEAERKLKASERRLATTLRCLSDSVLVVDKSGAIEFINEASEKLLGVCFSEVINKPLDSFICLLSISERTSLMDQVESTYKELPDTRPHEPLQSEAILIRPDREITVEIQCIAMHDETGGLIGGILVMRDISEEMRFKATQTYLEEKIFHVQKMEALGQLAGGIAHDFNNLLTAIIGNIALLKYHVIPDQQKLVSATEQACSRAAELVKQLLSFGRTDHETDKPVNIAPIIEEVVGVVKAASNQPIMIETRISEKVPAISGNSSQLYQVIMNLCMNARDAVFDARDIQGFNNDNNRTDIVITLEKRSTPQHLRATLGVDATEIVELRITDFGTGMSHETKRKIFEPFFTTKPVGKGTGLGLATVYGIVRRFGGAIELETNLGEGTTFRILLPAADELTSNSPSFSTLGASLRGSGLLLIADRDPLVRDIIGAMFGELGYEILCAGSDEELYRQLSDHSKRIRAILTNAELSDESGDGLIKNIRSRTPDTPLILITNHPIPALDSPKLTKVSVVQKPYKLHDLAREIASVTTAKVTNIKRMEQI